MTNVFVMSCYHQENQIFPLDILFLAAVAGLEEDLSLIGSNTINYNK